MPSVLTTLQYADTMNTPIKGKGCSNRMLIKIKVLCNRQCMIVPNKATGTSGNEWEQLHKGACSWTRAIKITMETISRHHVETGC